MPLMAKSRARRKPPAPPAPAGRVKLRSLPAARPAAPDPQIDFLILSLMSAIVPMIETRCGALNKRDQNTLKRHVEKAVREFVRRGQRAD